MTRDETLTLARPWVGLENSVLSEGSWAQNLAVQGTQVQSLVQEDPTCHKATKACVPQLLSLCYGALKLQLLSPRI